MTDSAERFLIVRLSSLGDLVHTLPAVAALRRSVPAAGIDWLVDRRWPSLIKLVEGVDEVIPLDRSVAGHLACVRRLRGARYSCAVDFQGLYRSAALTGFSGARRRIGRDRTAAREPGAACFYTERVRPVGRHIAEMNLSLAARAGAKPLTAMEFPLRVPDAERAQVQEKLAREGIADYVVVSPGGGWRSKLWPAERYGALCAELWRRHGLRAVVNAGPGEQGLADGVKAAAGPAKPVAMCPSLTGLAALVAGARLVVGADTGPVHLAAALRTPVVALFGPTDAARNGPLPRGRVVQNSAPEEIEHARGNYQHRGEDSPAMLSIAVEQVVAAAEGEMRGAA
jgi:heptosyltransferase-1